MGSGCSSLSERRRKPNKTKRRLSSFICGSSSSRATVEIEDYPVELLVNSAGYSRSVPDDTQSLHKESTLLRSSEGVQFTNPKSGRGCLSDTSTLSSEGRFLENYHSHHVHKESRSSQPGTSSTGFNGDQSSRDVDSDDQENDGFPENSVEGHSDVQTGVVDSSYVVSPTVSSSNIGSQSLGDDSMQDPMPLDLGSLMSDRVMQGSTEGGNLLHVDITSVSSANFSGRSNEISTREARRNSRRMFWDAFSSRNSRRHADFSTILFATDDVENIGSRRSWRLVDFGSNIFNDVNDDLWHLGRRNLPAGEQRSHSRSEFWGRLRGRTGERGGGERIICPSGLHPDGSCLCGLEDETNSRSSMSRIVMLAEALFEVLDDIHRQPNSFGLSIFSNPAPESAVDSLPVKPYEKSTAVESGEDVEQCYICLEEYEIGDQIRILPCTHEYHMTCVDKWLKEIHGVCPLCRGDVRQGATDASDGSSTPIGPV